MYDYGDKRRSDVHMWMEQNKNDLFFNLIVRKMTVPAIYCLLLKTRVHGRDEIVQWCGGCPGYTDLGGLLEKGRTTNTFNLSELITKYMFTKM